MPDAARVSVCLCTYNGAAFLAAQLESILRQTRVPDEVLIRDDASTDATLEIATRFARSAPFPVRVSANERNAGYVRNFGSAVADATGDVILLADQDDVWMPAKLERISAVFARSPEAVVAFSDAEVVDASLRPLPGRLWARVGFTPARRRRLRRGGAFGVLLRGAVVTGAAMAFRASLRELVLPIEEGYAHDAWIALLGAAVGGVVAIEEPLLRYRQHEANQIGAAVPRLAERIARARRGGSAALEARRDWLVRVLARLESRGAGGAAERRQLRDAIAHLDRRLSLPRRRLARIPPVWGEAVRGRYHRFGEGLPSALRDLIL